LKFTIVIPVASGTTKDLTLAEYVAGFARTAEVSGFDAIAISEHPAPSAKWLERGGHESLDPFVALAYCAAVTTKLRIMPYLAVLPYRNPLLTAKAIATLDLVSQGRLVVVAGSGYLRSEFRALGVDFEERNALMDEALAVLTRAWLGGEIAYEGRHFQAIGQVSRPAPIQQPHPPLWIGGNSQQAQERAARYGSGWAPVQMDPDIATTTRTAPLATVGDVQRAIERMRSFVRQSEAGDRPFTVQLDAKATNFWVEQTMESRLAELRELSSAGVDRCVVQVPPGDLPSCDALIRQIGRIIVEPLSDHSFVSGR
jgi:probable F420-dependent oxidoreductase